LFSGRVTSVLYLEINCTFISLTSSIDLPYPFLSTLYCSILCTCILMFLVPTQM
jgi:hypothetical protein